MAVGASASSARGAAGACGAWGNNCRGASVTCGRGRARARAAEAAVGGDAARGPWCRVGELCGAPVCARAMSARSRGDARRPSRRAPPSAAGPPRPRRRRRFRRGASAARPSAARAGGSGRLRRPLGVRRLQPERLLRRLAAEVGRAVRADGGVGRRASSPSPTGAGAGRREMPQNLGADRAIRAASRVPTVAPSAQLDAGHLAAPRGELRRAPIRSSAKG